MVAAALGFALTGSLRPQKLDISQGLDRDWKFNPEEFEHLNLPEFDKLQSFHRTDYSSLSPESIYDYWEYRRNYITSEPEVIIASGGELDFEELTSMQQQNFKLMTTPRGFGNICLPNFCLSYLVSIGDGNNQIWTSAEDILEFLGALDSREDLALYLWASDFHSGLKKATGAIKIKNDGYEVVLMSSNWGCFTQKRFWLDVSSNGDVRVLAVEQWEPDQIICT
jgi:hypothetical protein